VEAEGLAEISVQDAAPVEEILCVKRKVEAKSVTEDGDVGGGCTFAEHLDDGVAGDEVDEEKDDRDHHPEDREGGEDAADGFGERWQWSVLRCELGRLVG
jgi:hypothetical protein